MIEVEVKLPIYRRSITERGLKEAGFEAGDLIEESDICPQAAASQYSSILPRRCSGRKML